MRNQKGFTYLELLFVTAILGVIAAIAIPTLFRARTQLHFRTYFGVQLYGVPSEEQVLILQPLVTRRLRELEALSDVQEKELFALLPATTAEEAQTRLAKLQDIQGRVENLTRAQNAAKELGFRID